MGTGRGNRDLNIVIRASLDTSRDAITDLNAQVSLIAQRIQPLRIRAEFDSKQLNEVLKQIQQAQRIVQNGFGRNVSNRIRVFDEADIKGQIRTAESLGHAVAQLRKQFGDGRVSSSTSLHPLTNELQGFTIKIEEANGYMRKFRGELIHIRDAQGDLRRSFQIVNVGELDKAEKMLHRVNLEQYKMLQQVQQLRANGVVPQKTIDNLESVVRGSTNLEELKYAKTYYKEIIELQRQLLAVERERAQTAREHQRYQEMLERLFRQQQIEQERAAQREAERIKRLTEQQQYQLEMSRQNENLRVSRMGTVLQSDLPLGIFNNKSAMQDLIASQYQSRLKGISADMINLTRVIDANGNEIYKWSTRVAEGNGKMVVLSGSIDKATRSLYEFDQNMKDAPRGKLGMLEELKIALERVPTWAIATTAIYGTKHALEQMIQTIIEVDANMTQLKRVMDEETDFDAMLEKSIDLAGQLGRDLSDVQKTMADFAQQGFNQYQLGDVTRTAIVAANVSDLTAQQAASDLTSAMIQFNIAAKDSITIVDKLNEVDNNFAVTTKTLAEGIHKAGSSAKTYGVTLDELIGHITAISAATRESGNVVGNGLKTIYSRLGGDDQVSALRSVGIEYYKLNGEARSVSDVLGELATKWDNLSNTQQQQLGVVLAGRYQLTRFLALMTNWQMGAEATNTALHSTGSAMQENARYQKSLEAEISKLKTAWEALSVTIGENGLGQAFGAIVKTLTVMANGFTKLTEATYGLNVWVPVLAGTFIGLRAVFNSVTASMGAMGIAAKGLQLSFGWIGVIATGVSLLTSALIGSSQAVSDDAQKLIDSAKEHETVANQVTKLSDRYVELSEKVGKTTQEQQELKSVMQELERIAPTVADAFKKNADNLDEASQKAKAYAESMRSASDAEKERARTILQIQLSKQEQEAKEAKDELDSTSSEMDSRYLNRVRELQKAYNTEDIQEIKQKVDAELKELSGKMIQGIKVSSQEIRAVEERKRWIREIESSFTDFNSKFGEKQQKYQEAQGAVDLTRKQLQAINDLTNANSQAEPVIRGANAALMEQGDVSNENASQLGANESRIADLASRYDELTDSLGTVNKLLNDSAQGKQISADEAMKLIMKEKELANAFTIESGQVKINQQAIEVWRNAKIKAFQDSIAAQNADLANSSSALMQKLKMYGVEIQAIQSVADAKTALAQMDARHASDLAKAKAGQDGYNFDYIDMDYLKTKSEVLDVMSYYQQIESLKGMAGVSLKQSGLSSSDLNPKESKGKSASGASIEPVDVYQMDVYKAKATELEGQLKRLDDRKQEMVNTSKEYRGVIDQEIAVMKQQQQNFHAEANHYRAQNKTYNDTLYNLRTLYKQDNETIRRANELAKKIEENNNKIAQLGNSYMDTARKIEQLDWDKQISYLDELHLNVTSVESSLQLLQKRVATMDKTSQDYRVGLQEAIAMYQTQQRAVHEEANAIRALMNSGTLSQEQTDQMKKRLNELQIAWWDYAGSIKKTQDELKGVLNTLADDVISAWKEYYQDLQKVEEEAFKKREQDERDRHEKELKRIDDEYKAFEDATNKKIRLLEDKANEEDFQDQLKKDQKEAQELQRQIDVLALDNSFEAKAKREELERQLAEKREEIQKNITKHNREQTKRQLEDDLDSMKKRTDKAKEEEDRRNKNEEDSIRKQLEASKKKYEELINDDRHWSEVRKQILDQNFKDIQENFGTMTQTLKDLSGIIGTSLSNNLIDKLNNAKKLMEEINKSDKKDSNGKELPPSWTDGVGTGYNPNWKSSQELYKRDKAARDKEIQRVKSVIEYRKKNKMDISEQEAYLRRLESYHTGGLVDGGSNGSGSSIMRAVNSLFNVKPNERIVKALKGELFAPEENVTKNFIPNIKNMLKSSSNAVAVEANKTFHLTIHIDNLNGTKKDADYLLGEIVKGTKKLGLNI